MSLSNATFATIKNSLMSHRAKLSADMQYVNADKGTYSFSETTFTASIAYGIDLEKIASLPQKQIKRTMQFLNACVSGQISGFDRTHARILIAMREAGKYQLNTDAIHALASGIRSGTVNVRGITLAQINSAKVSAQGMGTVTSKTSNSTGKNGFMQFAGMTFADNTVNHAVFLNHGHDAVKRFFSIVDGSTMGQLSVLTETEGSK